MKRKIIGFAIILLWVFSRAVKSYSAGDADLQELSMAADVNVVYGYEADWYSNGEVKFAINIFDDEWKELNSKEEALVACQVPYDLLCKLTTHELLMLVEDYPMLGDIYAGNTMEEGFQYVIDSFNGLRELLERADCLDVVCEEYNKLTFPESCAISYSECRTEEEKVALFNEILHNDELLKTELEDSKPLIVCDLLELIMVNKTTEENVELLLDTVVDKVPEKEKSEYFESADKSLYISELDESMLSDISAYAVTGADSNITIKKVYWRGVAIEVKAADKLTYLTYSQAMDLIDNHPDKDKLSLVSIGNQQYNCHSYAWLKKIFPRDYHKYWLNNVPLGLMKECIEYTEPYYGAVAYTAQHSAVVVDENNKVWKDGRWVLDPIVVAKWAGGPVFRGPMSAGNYPMEHGNGVKYYYYRTLTK